MSGLYQIMYFTLIDIKNTLLSPFFIIIFAIIYYQYYQMCRQIGSISISPRSTLLKTLNSTFYGILGGFVTTIAFIYLEVVVIPKDFMYILAMAIILSFIDTRFMCFAYGGSLVSLSSILIGFPSVENKDIMLVVATLHVVESILVLINGSKDRQPTFFHHEEGTVGGFNMNRFWPIPFVIFIGHDLIKPITLMAILNYGDFTLSYPKRKSIFTGILMLIYSSLLLIITKSTVNNIFPPLFAILGHEIIIFINKLIEKNRVPIFSAPFKGVRVLEVVKKGIGNDIGLEVGDIIISINGVIVYDDKDLKNIELLSNDDLKIIYFNKKKGITEKVYRGKRKALGISIVPRA